MNMAQAKVEGLNAWFPSWILHICMALILSRLLDLWLSCLNNYPEHECHQRKVGGVTVYMQGMCQAEVTVGIWLVSQPDTCRLSCSCSEVMDQRI